MLLIVVLRDGSQTAEVFRGHVTTVRTQEDVVAFALSHSAHGYDSVFLSQETFAGPVKASGQLYDDRTYTAVVTRSLQSNDTYLEVGAHEEHLAAPDQEVDDDGYIPQCDTKMTSAEGLEATPPHQKPYSWTDRIRPIAAATEPLHLDDLSPPQDSRTIKEEELVSQRKRTASTLGYDSSMKKPDSSQASFLPSSTPSSAVSARAARVEASATGFPLNEKLKSSALEDVLVDSRGKEILERLVSDVDFRLSATKEERCYVKRKITKYLLRHSNIKNAPSNGETRAFVWNLFQPFPTVDVSTFVGRNSACLEVHLRQVQQQLKRDGFYKTRPYAKRQKMHETDCAPESASDLYRLNTLPAFSVEHLHLLEKTRNSRAAFCRFQGPEPSFRRYPILEKGEIVLEDFCYHQGIQREVLARRWIRELLPMIDLMAERGLTAEKMQAVQESNFLHSDNHDSKSYGGLLKLLASFAKGKHRDLSRSKNIFVSFPLIHTAETAIQQLAESGITQPVICSYGDSATSFIVAVNGRAVKVPGDWSSALLVLIAVYYVFNLMFPEPVKPEMELLSHLLGVKHVKLTESARRVLSALDEAAQV